MNIVFPDPHSVVPPSTTPHTTASSAAYTAAAVATSTANHVASLAMGQGAAAMNGSASSQQLFQPTSSELVLHYRKSPKSFP